ncbi:MAG TPA: S9 family peptidase [Gemmatimonadaceae bacterium]|nr:S9 family peptidase [Gemmatimonadaceae bacterium]
MTMRPTMRRSPVLAAVAILAAAPFAPATPAGAQQTPTTNRAAAVAATPGAAPRAGAAARAFDLADLGRIVRVADPQISPDGRSIAVVVSRADFDVDRWMPELVLVDVATGAQRQLVAARRGLTQPRWKPTGDRIAFLATEGDGKDAAAQLFVMPTAGGDARRVTSAAKGVQHYAWRPDGREVAFATADEPEKRTGSERFNDSFEVGNDDYLVMAAPTPTHVWLVAADGSAPARRLTSGAWSLPTVRPPGPPAAPLSWSPDGRLLAFTRVPTPHSGDFDSSAVSVLDVAACTASSAQCAPRPVTGAGLYEGFPVFSPDGGRLAYWYPRGGEQGSVTEIHVAPVAGGAGRSVTRGIDRNMARALWMPDGKTLLVGANDGTRVSLWLQPVDGAAAPRKLDLGALSPSSSFWVDVAVGRGGSLAFTATTPDRPAELYYLAAPNAKPRRLTDFNHDVAALALGRTEVVRWAGAAGTSEQNGTLTYPPGYVPGRRYPLVLVVHGGPRAATLETFSPQAQLMAAKGWLVFQPNYRGSDQLGDAYQRAIVGDAGEGPGRDVMAGVAAVTGRGIVDTTRIAVSGWSYGGYMTTWLAGRYPGVWRVAVAGAPVTDWIDQYALGDGNVRRRYGFGGSPYTDTTRLRAYVEQSPISVAPKIRAPTLVMHDVGDDRVTVTQGYKLYHVLRDNGVESKFIAYPISGHNAADPVRQRDVQRRWVEWIEQHFGGPSPTASR